MSSISSRGNPAILKGYCIQRFDTAEQVRGSRLRSYHGPPYIPLSLQTVPTLQYRPTDSLAICTYPCVFPYNDSAYGTCKNGSRDPGALPAYGTVMYCTNYAILRKLSCSRPSDVGPHLPCCRHQLTGRYNAGGQISMCAVRGIGRRHGNLVAQNRHAPKPRTPIVAF